MRIGFIGVVIMGSRMAANLQRAGCELVVNNRTSAKAKELIDFDRDTVYRIGARGDVDAPITSQLNGSYWEPFVYDTYRP